MRVNHAVMERRVPRQVRARPCVRARIGRGWGRVARCAALGGWWLLLRWVLPWRVVLVGFPSPSMGLSPVRKERAVREVRERVAVRGVLEGWVTGFAARSLPATRPAIAVVGSAIRTAAQTPGAPSQAVGRPAV